MSLTISRAKGVTVYTLHSKNKSKWPLICQILGTMCCSPVCSVSQRLKQELSCTLTVLATIQIMVGIINLGFGSLSLFISYISYVDYILLWIGGVITGIGIICILAEKFPSPCLVFLTILMNIVSAALAITSIVNYSMHLAGKFDWRTCEVPKRQVVDRYYWTTPSPTKIAMWEEDFKISLETYRVCEENRLIKQKLFRGLDIMMIVLSVLHLCVAITWCVLSIKALCKKQADAEDLEDPELHKSLLEEENSDFEC